MRILSLATTLLALSTLTSSAAPPDRKTGPADLKGMAWIAGAWQGSWGGDFHAYYSTPEGGKLLSHSELLRDGKVVLHEFEKFAVRDGVATLTPYPGGRPAATFRLTESDAAKRRAVFENPDKDFPTRIEYGCPEPGRLVIVLSDPHGGSEKVERIELHREK